MKALHFHEHGGLDKLNFGDVPDPKPGPKDALVATRCAALNHLDLFVMGGMPGIDLAMPHVPGSDAAGVVEEVGSDVRGLQAGDRVMLNACVWCGRCEFCLRGEHSMCVRLQLVGEHRWGTYAERFIAPEASLAKIPEGVGFKQAAAFSLVFQTAWRMLTTRSGLQAGQDVFIHGIGGGVATACLQIAKMAGARAFVSSSSDDKLAKARELGADFTYNYRDVDVAKEVSQATGKRGVDIVVDSVGRSTWLQSLKMVRRGGHVVTCGATTGPNPETEVRLIFWKQINIAGSTMSNAIEFAQLVKLLGEGRLSPVVDRAFPLSDGRQALKRLKNQNQFGKIVLEVRT